MAVRHQAVLQIISVIVCLAAGAAAQQLELVTTAAELRAALSRASVSEVLLATDLELSSWQGQPTLNITHDVKIKASDELRLKKVYPTLDWASVAGAIRITPNVTVTFQGLELLNYGYPTSFTLIYVALSPGGIIISQDCRLRRRVALPSALSVAPLNAAPASPRFPGSAATRSVQLLKAVGSPNNQSICYMTITKQVCSNVDALLLKDWTTSSTYDLALAGTGNILGGYDIGVYSTVLVVEHDVPIACLRSGKSPADCVAAKLAELDALDQAAGGGKDNSAHERLVLGLCIGLIVGFVLICAALLMFWQHRRSQHTSLLGAVLAPAAGPDTTLLISDIQNSTKLWEDLPVAVMDEALRQHHATIRRLLKEHRGYESATEGDSFLLAFHTAQDAARFALACQEALLAVDWPQELLQHADGGELWLSAPATTAATAAAGLNGEAAAGSVTPSEGSRAAIAAGQSAKTLLTASKVALARMASRGGNALAGAKAGGGADASAVRIDMSEEDLAGGSSPGVGSPKLSAKKSSRAARKYEADVAAAAEAGTKSFNAGSSSMALRAQVLMRGKSGGPPSPASSRPTSTVTSPNTATSGTGVSVFATVKQNYLASTPSVPASEGALTADTATLDMSNSRPQTASTSAYTTHNTHPGPAGSALAAFDDLLLDLASEAAPFVTTGMSVDALAEVLASAWQRLPHKDAYAAAVAHGGSGLVYRDSASKERQTRCSSATVGDASTEVGDHDEQHAGHSAYTEAATVATDDESAAMHAAPAAGEAKGDAAKPMPVDGVSFKTAAAEADNNLMLESHTWGEYCRRRWPQYHWDAAGDAAAGDAGANAGRVLALRGLRVRMGLHSGLQEGEYAHNATTGRMAYSGGMLKTAKAVGDAAAGGMVLVTTPTFNRLLPYLASMLPNKDAGPVRVLYCGDAEELGAVQACAMYALLTPPLVPRIGYLPPLRGINLLQLGCVDAPVGREVIIAFFHIANTGPMISELGAAGREALAQAQDIIIAAATEHRGFIVESTESLTLVALGCPLAALRWALTTRSRLMHHDWSYEVLESQWFEEVKRVVSAPSFIAPGPRAKSFTTAAARAASASKSASGFDAAVAKAAAASAGAEGDAVILARGPRIRCGLARGQVRADVSEATGRLAYRGKVMNRAARISFTAGEGQIVCASEVWHSARLLQRKGAQQNSSAAAEGADAAAAAASGGAAAGGAVQGLYMGSFCLKGVPQPAELYEVEWK